MTDLEKIETCEEFNRQINEKQDEKREREKSFKAYIAKLTKDFDESQAIITNEIEELSNQKYDYTKNNTVIINLADLLNELKKLTKIKPEVNLIVEMPIADFRKYSEENIEETFDQFDRLNSNITIKLDNYRTYPNDDYNFSFAYIHLIKRDEPHKNDCLLRLFKENNLLGKSIQINYDLDKVFIELPLYYVFEYDIVKQAIINCLKKQEIKDKSKLLEL